MSIREQLQKNFKRLAQENQLSHAYLFFGGDRKNYQDKFVFAKSLANFLENEIFEEPKSLLKETLIISPNEAGAIGIDIVRDLKFFLWQKPVSSAKRTAIIFGAENLTDEAQNAALKIVEEPPENGLIIFISGTAEDLFPTLVSRTQRIFFSSEKGNDNELVLTDNEIDRAFENLILDLQKDKIKNSQKLKEVLRRLVLIKQFNTNKKLQWRSLVF